MTGEVTLRGKVLAIGGLKQKTIAAHRAGIKTVIMPKDNAKDIPELPQRIRDDLTLIPVQTLDEVLKIALLESDIPPFSVDAESSQEDRLPVPPVTKSGGTERPLRAGTRQPEEGLQPLLRLQERREN